MYFICIFLIIKTNVARKTPKNIAINKTEFKNKNNKLRVINNNVIIINVFLYKDFSLQLNLLFSVSNGDSVNIIANSEISIIVKIIKRFKQFILIISLINASITLIEMTEKI